MYVFLRQNVYVKLNHILTEATKLIDSGHYASQHIQQVRLRAGPGFCPGYTDSVGQSYPNLGVIMFLVVPDVCVVVR